MKAGTEVVKTVLDRRLTFAPGPGETQAAPDLMSGTEQAAASAMWNAVQAAVQRLELG